MISPVYKTCQRQKNWSIKAILSVLTFILAAQTQLSAQVLTCPDDYTVQLPPNECDVNIFYDSLDWSSTIPLFDPVYFPLQGSNLQTGITTITLAATDANNNFYTCDFEVNILSFNSSNFNCPSQVAVSLQGECERPLTATDVLDVTYLVCDEDYVVDLLAGNQWVTAVIGAEDVGQSFNVRLTNVETGHDCETIVTVMGGEPAAITCPPNVMIYCNEPTDTGYIGTPLITGCFENLEISFTDEFIFTQCPDTLAFQIERTWVAISPNGSQTQCSHLITGRRFPSNFVQFPEDFDGVANPALSCSDSLNLTQTTHPDITGWPLAGDFPPNANIHCKFAISYVDNITSLCGDSYRVKRAWSVVNLCTAFTRRDTQTILVLDETPPIFEIPDTVFFSLSGGCIDSVFLPSANMLSECSAYDFLLQTPWGDFSENGLWVHPDTTAGNYEINYLLTDACDNDTTQTLILKITDETLVSCPPNDTIDCDFYFTTIFPALQTNEFEVLYQLGLPSFYFNCEFELTETDTSSVDDCGDGWIQRTITAFNTVDTLTCTQEITVQHRSDFEVLFPADTSLCVSLAQADLPEPELSLVSCEAITTTFSDVILPSGLPGCFTVFRTWVVINNCAYAGSMIGTDSLIAPRKYHDNGDGIITYTQTIHVNDNTAIEFTNGCEIPDLFVGPDCLVDIIVPTPDVLGCGSNIALTVSGSLGTVLGASASLLPGQYNVTYKAIDECGKMQTCLTSFEVIDTTAPVVVCAAGISIEILSASCSVDVWANDLASGSTDNCGFGLNFSYSQNDENDFLRNFTTCELGLHELEVWVTDNYGNQSSCLSTFIIEDNSGNCGECSPTIGGKIETDAGPDIFNVEVSVTSTNGFDQTVYTNANGDYSTEVINGGDYLLTPSHDTLPSNGVTTFDMVLIRRHILGSDTLDTPYKIIAADVNNSGAVTTFDMVEIRKLILQINDGFPNNTSWRFVPADYVFPNPLSPFTPPFPESILLNDVTLDNIQLDFIGIKIGDVNGSANTSPFGSPNESQK